MNRFAQELRKSLTYSYEKFLDELGRKLRQMRVDRGWTLRDMILEHGFHLAHWQGFEKGRGISIPSLLRVCELFDLPLETLIAGLGLVQQEPETGQSPSSDPKGAEGMKPAIPAKSTPGRSPRSRRVSDQHSRPQDSESK